MADITITVTTAIKNELDTIAASAGFNTPKAMIRAYLRATLEQSRKEALRKAAEAAGEAATTVAAGDIT